MQRSGFLSYSLHFHETFLEHVMDCPLLLFSFQAKKIERGGETKNRLCYSDRVNVALHNVQVLTNFRSAPGGHTKR